MKAYLVRIFLCLLTCALVGGLAAARTIEFETTEVTAADVTVSPDGQWLIFTMLGHLFRLPVEGGTAEQLTFGPYYDSDPVFSPDGNRVAFVSDRDGSDGNVFVLELATGQITQVTHETWAGRPTWTPDGQGIVYLSYVFEAAQPKRGWGSARIFPALMRRIALSGAEPETLSAPLRLFRSVFYLPDGRLAWTVIGKPETGSPRWTTRIEVMSAQGTVSTLRTLEGVADRVVASATGEGFYCRCYVPLMFYSLTQKDDILFLPLPTGAERQILAVSGLWYSSPRFAVAADNKTLYVGNSGRLWEVTLPGGARKPIGFRAQVKLEIQDPVPPPQWAPPAPGSSAPPRSVLQPRLSPDGRSLVFGAAGYLWEQSLNKGQVQRLSEGNAVEYDPAFSPDGRQLAFASGRQGKGEIKVLSFETRQTRTLASGSFEQLSWSPDGQRLVFARDGHRLVAMNVSDGRIEELFEAGDWEPYPHFSADGQSVYFTADGTLYRLQLKEKAKPEPITQLARHIADALVSPNEKWLAFRRKVDIWVAPLGKEPVKEEDIHQLSPEGGSSFAFTSDGSALIYSAGNRVWRHPLTGGEREEIPIRLELQRPTPPPRLLRGVRVLNLDAGRFGPETSLFIEQGRIRWIGSERGRKLPQGTVVVDAGGRFAIPGLFDMHVHTWFDQQAAMLAYGVTSVRNTGMSLPWVNALADRSEATSDPVARHFYSGDMFRSAAPELGEARVLIENEDDARAYVRRWKERGVHFIKTHPPYTWRLRRAVAQEARRLGLPVVGHGLGFKEVTQSATFGYAVVEHASNRFYDDVLQMLALAGTRWDPTLAVGGGNQLLLRNEPERLADEKFRAFTPEKRSRARHGRDRFKVLSDTALCGRSVERLATVRAAHRHGVRLLAGTDAPLDEAFSGVSLHWELEHFVQAGLTPLEVLRIATQEAAAAVGAEDELGTLEAGKLADLVLLDANPLEDIKNTQTIWRVIKGGWLFDPDKLRPPVSTSPDE
jgi:imidazolonepropionase-like amidohydrolase/Tol biopolymer transport system component